MVLGYDSRLMNWSEGGLSMGLLRVNKNAFKPLFLKGYNWIDTIGEPFHASFIPLPDRHSVVLYGSTEDVIYYDYGIAILVEVGDPVDSVAAHTLLFQHKLNPRHYHPVEGCD